MRIALVDIVAFLKRLVYIAAHQVHRHIFADIRDDGVDDVARGEGVGMNERRIPDDAASAHQLRLLLGHANAGRAGCSRDIAGHQLSGNA